MARSDFFLPTSDLRSYSHSIVLGGSLEMWSTTLLATLTSLMMQAARGPDAASAR